MTKDSNYHSHYEKSSQLSSEDTTKDLVDLTRRRNGQKPEHQIFLHFQYVTLFLCSYTCYNSVFLCVLVLFFHLAFDHGHLNCFLSCLSISACSKCELIWQQNFHHAQNLISAMHHHYHLILIFLFAFGSEPSHLLNHLVKFVQWGSSLGLTIYLLKILIISKVSPLKWNHLKSNHIMSI